VGAWLLAPGIVLVVAGIVGGRRWPALRGRAAFLLPAGAAVAPALLAWLNRDGPGTVCRTTGDVSACTEQWSPWPFLVVAVVMAAGGTFLALGGRRAKSRWPRG
jgi:hypothetical protein